MATPASGVPNEQARRPILLTERSQRGGMKKRERHRVTFSNEVRVAVIPSRNESGEVELGWWLPNHILLFKLSALREINSFLEKNPMLDHRTASHLLFNPAGTLFDGFRLRSTGSFYIHDLLTDLVDLTATALAPQVEAWSNAFQRIHRDVAQGYSGCTRLAGQMQAGLLVHISPTFLAPICFRR
ncbi:hypothetical protein B484DRAFT_60577 [Ochromonadaceae sp. CCMP2298]|nr:hypothetical protein B484DRAFT_60577 [Ochromonadaceae sp. CCMP2298]|mmetsp:Transcript_21372/g.47468  ORF Transcript_21372/g.47468 Transcript_21372/m.47468 type:complete len:185 (-) Transcript_21372:272-826(-)|eukprot:CAMPEP_0173208908 /NCGR_PEP_ID=MMETSP1141-20130122/22793_1 /TAXON_ID=483371 /ORGANISM="non described non described, Strain CCMP2298" /LENGTH=184 /DNA_ID=CAMNT_0014135443 /DNA_START=53 /DNA_END=607 /DNA_ORIENTATION=-